MNTLCLKRIGSVAAVSAALVLSVTPMAHSADAAAGEKLFKRCAACHTIGPGAKHKIGPHLNGIFGRTAASADGFKKYGSGLTEAKEKGLVWDEEKLAAYIVNPRNYIREFTGNTSAKVKMPAQGFFKGKEDRTANLFAYLQGFDSDGNPPAPAAEEPAATETEAAPAE